MTASQYNFRNLDDDEAILAMVDSNLHREQLLPSEKAFAYKMKFDALKRQGARSDLTSEQVAPKLSTEIIAEQENTSKDTIKRYIRLTKLIKPLLDLVDEGKIALTPAEKLSYLKEEEQRALAELIQDYEATPSLSQAVKLKEMSSSSVKQKQRMASELSICPIAYGGFLQREKRNRSANGYSRISLNRSFPWIRAKPIASSKQYSKRVICLTFACTTCVIRLLPMPRIRESLLRPCPKSSGTARRASRWTTTRT